MAIKPGKLAIILAGMKPKDEKSDTVVEEHDSEDKSDYDFHDCAEQMMKAVKSGDVDALASELKKFAEELRAEDEEQDETE